MVFCLNRKAFLLAWKKREGCEATYERLLKVSCVKDRGDVALVICGILKARLNDPEEIEVDNSKYK